MKFIKQNLIPFLFFAGILSLLIFPIWSHINQSNRIQYHEAQIDYQNEKIDDLIRANSQSEELLGGITRVAVGAGVKWTTDLVPSASFTVNLGSLTLPVNNIFGVGASLSGNLNFLGELKPDGVLCSNGEILKKTGANDWDCATDATGAATKAFGWIDANNSDGTFVSIGSISFDASHFTFSNTASLGYLRLDWGAGGPASLSEAETITGNWVNTANPWADNEVADAITINGGTVTWTDLTTYPTGCTNQFVTTIGDTLTCASVDISTMTNLTGGTGIALTNDDLTFAPTEMEAFTWGAGANASNVWTFNLTAGDPTMTWTQAGATLSLGFEAVGYASASKGYFTSLLRVPYSIGTVTTAGDFGIVASGLDFFNTAERLVRPKVCRTWAYEDPTAVNEWGRVFFDDPFTVTDVTVVTSGSNAVGWQMDHGLTGAITTDLMSSNKSASATFTYTTFGDATLVNSEFMMLSITSASSKIENLDITVCGEYLAP